jgi:probable phosphomutase (TIGR03848 family)
VTTVFLIRHASNDYLTQHRFAGWIPGVHLNAQGRAQAEALAQRLSEIPIHAVYSSPLERAVETAQFVASRHDREVRMVDDLRDTYVGEWQGMFIDEIKNTGTWVRIRDNPVGVRFGGGENIDEVQTRMVGALSRIVDAHPTQIVAVFGHSDPIKAAVAHYLEMDLNRFHRIVINPASLTVVAFTQYGPRLVRLNDCGDVPTSAVWD